MFRPRLLMGALVGGALVYFLDPDRGPARRARVRDWWDQNREPMMDQASQVVDQASQAASTAQAKVNEASAKVGEKVTELGSKVRDAANRQDVSNPLS